MELAYKQSPGVTIKAYIALLQDSYIRPGAQGTPYDSTIMKLSTFTRVGKGQIKTISFHFCIACVTGMTVSHINFTV